MIRNVVDHGIETPLERVDYGKPECGNLLIKAEVTKTPSLSPFKTTVAELIPIACVAK